MAHIPKPFKRPSVSVLDRTDRTWKMVFATNLSEGDIVTDKGQVEAIIRNHLVKVLFFSGETVDYRPDWVLRAFTEGEPVGKHE